MREKTGWCFSLFLIGACAQAIGADAVCPDDFSGHFQQDTYEVALMSGTMFSPIGADRHRNTVDYTLSGLQLGWMLTGAGEPAWWRGNLELSLEAMGGEVYEGRGNYIAGGTAWLRYNFVQPNWRLVPYVQAGVGAEGTDMDQRLIGENFNFNLDIAAGLRCFVAQNWALDLECQYQHISNATIARHDIGINAVGPMIGVSYFF
jgi:opacity protein-like surface antigen